MDPQHKQTLDLIEAMAPSLDPVERGRQLIQVAADYVVDGNLIKARQVLIDVGDLYLIHLLHHDAMSFEAIKVSAAILIDAFGLELVLAISHGQHFA